MNSLHYEFKEGIGRWAYLKSRWDFLFKVSRLDYNFVPEEVASIQLKIFHLSLSIFPFAVGNLPIPH
jgi:hypothetical protein